MSRWYKIVDEVKVGDKVENNSNGTGTVTKKTTRTVTVEFENGNVVKNTYKSKENPFWDSDFS